MGEKQKKQDIRSDLLLLAALIAWAFFVNRQFRISGLYKDEYRDNRIYGRFSVRF